MLDAIRQLCLHNLNAVKMGEKEPFPDFRPANLGVKAGTSELIYIDFNQTGEIQDLGTLRNHLEQWAGRRYPRDPGGARNIHSELMAYLCGEGNLPSGRGGSSGLGAIETFRAE